ncbi:MAG: heat shock protein Hsp20 [Arthrobacter sp.]|nr:heat shock protein Hsp20 [Arthrobacter sp.]MCU1548607.1 heat shock protein Hsp20 [Arthrobacter sp.]
MADLNKWGPSEVLEPIRRFLEGDMTMSAMRVEQFVDGNTLVVRAELPGIDPDKDLELSVTDGVLHLKAEREEKSEHKSKTGYRSEFRYGTFTRSFPLPDGVREEDITATYKDGVLEVRAPVRPTAPDTSARKIRIDHG